MIYELTGLKEHGIFVGLPKTDHEGGDMVINWTFGLNIDFPGKDSIHLTIDAKIEVSEPADHPNIGHFSATHFFSVPNMLTDFVPKSGKELLQFLATLVGISLGSMRGLAYARTYNVFGEAVFMPVVNPTALLQQSLPQLLAKSQAFMKAMEERDPAIAQKAAELMKQISEQQ